MTPNDPTQDVGVYEKVPDHSGLRVVHNTDNGREQGGIADDEGKMAPAFEVVNQGGKWALSLLANPSGNWLLDPATGRVAIV